MDRTALLRGLIDTSGLGLEIGPSYNPLVPKAAGFRVETVDYTDQAGLRAKYAGNPHVDPGLIEPVDHVLDGSRTLAEAVATPGRYDYIVASHVIEHVPDLLGFVQSCEWLLRPGGVVLLAVPDKRHCFDVLQPLSTTGDVLQAHLERRTRPTPGAVFDDRAYNAVRAGAIGWDTAAAGPLTFFADLHDAKAGFEAAQQPGYIDVHVWRFVPSSFRLIMGDLHATGQTSLLERSFHDSVGNEFYMSLATTGTGSGEDRMTLALKALREHATILA